MSQKKVLIVVDNPIRDLNACVLLATTLADQGIQVLLSPMSQAPADTFQFRPQHVVLNYLRAANASFVRKLIFAGITWSVLDTEGGVFGPINDGESDSYLSSIAKDEYLRSQISACFVWGHRLYDRLQAASIYPLTALKLTGTPRIDFLHPSFKKFFQYDQKIGPLILINTSFAFINPKFQTLEKEAQDLIDFYGYDPLFVKKMIVDESQAMAAYTQLSLDLCTLLPDQQFILRPHPFESLAVYEKTLGHLKNINVICEKSIDFWLEQAVAIVHFECTTAIEASLVGKPAFSLSQYRSLRPIPDTQAVTHFSASAKEMSESLRETFQQPEKFLKSTELKQVVSDIYFQFDGLSHQRVADEIIKILEGRKSKAIFLLAMSCYYSLRTVLKWILRGTLVSPGKRFNREDVQQIVTRLSAIKKSVYRTSKPLSISGVLIDAERRP